MIKYVVGDELTQRICGLKDFVQFRDENGNVLGHFMPSSANSPFEGLDEPPSEEELQQAENESGRSLSEILADLGS
jgi:hypothetical protein